MIGKGADVNARAIDGHTPLHHAVESGNRDVVQLLLSVGAHIAAADAWGATPVSLARDDRSLLNVLLDGGDVNALDDNGFALQGLELAASASVDRSR